MINNYIFESLKISNVKTVDELENALREMSQKIILSALSKTSFFNYAAFYGGTCLRVFHGLNRYSEDLDFTFIKDIDKFNMGEYIEYAKITLKSYGIDASVYTKDEYDTGEIRRRYIKFPYYDLAREYLGNVSMNKEKMISIKVEVSSIFINGATLEWNMLNIQGLSSILCLDYPSLFAGKINAILTREWRKRVKGRDYYDYIFYLSHGVSINIEYLKNKLCYSTKEDTSGFDIDKIKSLLKERFEDVSIDSILLDITPFVVDSGDLSFLSNDFLIKSLELLKAK